MSAYGLETLSREECMDLLRSARLGRMGVDTGERPAILPVLYGLLDGDVVVRTAPGSKLVAAVLGRVVPFEVDDHDPRARSGWSVLVVGHAEELVSRDEVARAEALGLQPWAGAARDRWVRIRSEHVSGRRVRAAPERPGMPPG